MNLPSKVTWSTDGGVTTITVEGKSAVTTTEYEDGHEDGHDDHDHDEVKVEEEHEDHDHDEVKVEEEDASSSPFISSFLALFAGLGINLAIN